MQMDLHAGINLAKVLAAGLGRRLVRLQCYEGLDETKALYEWEYSKQMLYTQLLRDKLSELLSGAGTLTPQGTRSPPKSRAVTSRACTSRSFSDPTSARWAGRQPSAASSSTRGAN